jgi:hypothetical protein
MTSPAVAVGDRRRHRRHRVRGTGRGDREVRAQNADQPLAVSVSMIAGRRPEPRWRPRRLPFHRETIPQSVTAQLGVHNWRLVAA